MRTECGTCGREVPIRTDGRLRGHLASGRNSAGRRQCDGSGSYGVPAAETEPPHPNRPMHTQSAAARFNARAEWAKSDSLWREYRDQVGTNAASYEADDSAWEAYERAVEYAQELDRLRLA